MAKLLHGEGHLEIIVLSAAIKVCFNILMTQEIYLAFHRSKSHYSSIKKKWISNNFNKCHIFSARQVGQRIKAKKIFTEEIKKQARMSPSKRVIVSRKNIEKESEKQRWKLKKKFLLSEERSIWWCVEYLKNIVGLKWGIAPP